MQEESFVPLGDYTDRDTFLDTLIVQEAVAELPLSDQAIIAMDTAGYIQKQIGSILGLSRTTVWSRTNSALDRLKGMLHDRV